MKRNVSERSGCHQSSQHLLWWSWLHDVQNYTRRWYQTLRAQATFKVEVLLRDEPCRLWSVVGPFVEQNIGKCGRSNILVFNSADTELHYRLWEAILRWWPPRDWRSPAVYQIWKTFLMSSPSIIRLIAAIEPETVLWNVIKTCSAFWQPVVV